MFEAKKMLIRYRCNIFCENRMRQKKVSRGAMCDNSSMLVVITCTKTNWCTLHNFSWYHQLKLYFSWHDILKLISLSFTLVYHLHNISISIQNNNMSIKLTLGFVGLPLTLYCVNQWINTKHKHTSLFIFFYRYYL